MTILHYITIATKPHIVLDNLKRTIAKQNETIEVLGESVDRYIGWESNGNFGIKLKEVHDFIHRQDLNITDIVLFTDAYDVAYFGNQCEIIARFRSIGLPLVFGGERYCFPDSHIRSEYKNRSEEFSYLNSGMFIGYVWALRLCMSQYVYKDEDDDQRFWTRQFIENPYLITIDYKNELFLNMHDIDMSQFEYRDNQVYYKGRNPLFIHVNGPDKSLISQFILTS